MSNRLAIQRERAVCQAVNPDRALCIERIEREHAEAVLRDMATLPLEPRDIARLQELFRRICPDVLHRIRDALDEYALLHGAEVLYSLTYAELSEKAFGVAQHRDSIIAGALKYERGEAQENCDDVRVALLDRALRTFTVLCGHRSVIEID